MGKTRPGIDRITKQQLTAQAVAAEAELSTHLHHCIVCKRAANNLRKRCGYWWALARRAHRARRKLAQFNQPETANIDTLPGMGEL
jgi:hypothetical protein